MKSATAFGAYFPWRLAGASDEKLHANAQRLPVTGLALYVRGRSLPIETVQQIHCTYGLLHAVRSNVETHSHIQYDLSR